MPHAKRARWIITTIADCLKILDTIIEVLLINLKNLFQTIKNSQ